MNKQAIKKIETIQGKIQALWAELGSLAGSNCQTAARELEELRKKLERDTRKK
jgi:ElaB/YqjD/DUF883 family membrane-anchored ribosome-binding protein